MSFALFLDLYMRAGGAPDRVNITTTSADDATNGGQRYRNLFDAVRWTQTSANEQKHSTLNPFAEGRATAGVE